MKQARPTGRCCEYRRARCLRLRPITNLSLIPEMQTVCSEELPSTIRRRLAALSSLYKHLVRRNHAPRNPVGEVERPGINRDEGATAAFSKSAGAQTARPAG